MLPGATVLPRRGSMASLGIAVFMSRSTGRPSSCRRNGSVRREARAALFENIEIFYNRQRCHLSIGYRKPVQARMDINMAKAALIKNALVQDQEVMPNLYHYRV